MKPSAIYGTRHTESGYPIPLAPVMAPLSYALRIGRPVTGFVTGLAPSLLDGLLEPPVPVHAVAQTVVDMRLEEDEPGLRRAGRGGDLARVNCIFMRPSSGPPRRSIRVRRRSLSQNAEHRARFLGRVAVVRLVRPRRVLEAPKPKLDVVGRVVQER